MDRLPTTRVLSALLLWSVLVFGCQLPAHAQIFAPPDTSFIHDVWQTEEGLPHNSVTALYQGPDGFLWIGTAAGLVRFDGLRFVAAAHEQAPHLSYGYVWALLGDADGALWIGTGEGLTRLHDGHATTLTEEDGLPVNFVRVLTHDRQGQLWIGMYGGGVCRYAPRTNTDEREDEPGALTCYGVDEGLTDLFINAIEVGQDGVLWVGTGAGLYHLRGDRFQPVVTGQSALLDIGALVSDTQGTLWVGTGGGLHRLDGDTLVPASDTPVGAVRTLYEDDNETLWVGTEADGLFSYRDGVFRHFEPGSLVSEGDVRAVLQDRSGNHWVGTNGGGLNRLKVGRVRVVAQAEGLPSGPVHTVLEDRYGRIWLATSGGLVRWQNGAARVFTRKDGLPETRVLSLAEDGDGQLWVGTNGGGLSRYEDGQFTTYTTADGLPNNVVFALHADRSGRLWVGGQGLSLWTGEGFETFTASDGLASGLIVSVAEDDAGVLWFGSDNGGLSRYEDGQFTTYTTADGLSSNAVRTIHISRDGTVWIGTRGGGLNRYRNGTFTAFTTEEGLSDNIIFRILEDERGYLWLNTARNGIARVRKDELDAVARGVEARVSPLVLSRSDGLRSVEGVGGFHPAGWRTRSGTLWFPTHDGAAVVDPRRIEVDLTPPPVHIEEVLVDGEPVPISNGGLILRPGADRVEIRYTGLSFSDPARVRFRHQLQGKDEDWLYTGARRSWTYDNLAPGDYTFRVTAASPDGVWNRQPAELAMTVIPPWWRTWWAYGLYIVLLGAGLIGYVRWRVWSLHQRNDELEELVRRRTSQVAAQAEQLREMDEAKSQFFANLSHEFRTPLTLIQGPIETLLDRTEDDEERALLQRMRGQSHRLLRLINQLLDLSKLDAGRMPLHRQPHDLVAFLHRLVASFASLAEARGVSLDLRTEADQLPLSFDAEKLEQVFGNLLSNALKFTPEGGKVQLGIEPDADGVCISVRDTGTGIPEQALPHVFDRFYQVNPQAGTSDLGTGIGLALTRDLVQMHGGTIDVESQEGFGTTFTVRLPYTIPADDLRPAPDARTGSDDASDPWAADVSPEGDGYAKRLKLDDEWPDDKWSDDAWDDEEAGADAPLVLLVEDHADVRRFLRDTLRSRYRIIEAEHGRAGLERARAEHPDLIISDVMMPEMDGIDLCRAIREDDELSATPVVLLTARASEESRLEGLDAGADDYLAKPFSAAELVARAENLIEIRRHLRSRYSDEVIVGPSQVTVPSADAQFLDEVRAVVEAHIDDHAFSVERLAEEVHLSRRQLHRKIQALTDLSTVGFIRMMRLERAAQLLRQQAGTVSEIAYAVGFKDPNYFTRVFRQVHGQTPSEYMADPPPTDRTDD